MLYRKKNKNISGNNYKIEDNVNECTRVIIIKLIIAHKHTYMPLDTTDTIEARPKRNRALVMYICELSYKKNE